MDAAPSLLFDKSSFHGLREDVHARLHHLYSVVTAPPLIDEVVGDLRPADGSPGAAEAGIEKAAYLARRFGGRVESHRRPRDLLEMDLLGENVPLNRGPIIHNAIDGFEGGKRRSYRILGPDGSPVAPQANLVALLAARGRTTPPIVRTGTLEAEVDALWGRLKGSIARAQAPRNARDPGQQLRAESQVVQTVAGVLSEPARQLKLHAWLVDGLQSRIVPADTLRKRVKRRWLTLGQPLLESFAPYAHFWARVRLMYLVGFRVWPKGREENDLADLQYLQLLPFPAIFASNDKFVRAMAKHLLRPDQVLACSCKLRQEATGDSKDLDACERLHGVG